MLFVGIDLHKKIISLCVVNQERQVIQRKTLHCSQPDKASTSTRRLSAFVSSTKSAR